MKIVQYPHPALRHKAEPILALSKELEITARSMLDLMYEHRGLGLAGPQVAFGQRIIVMNFDPEGKNPELECVAINPVIIESKGTVEDREGCLSFPELYQKVRRAKTIKAQAYNLRGELFEMTCSDLAARLWQHEIDHLDGTLFIDKMGPLGRIGSRDFLNDFIQQYETARAKGDIPANLEPIL